MKKSAQKSLCLALAICLALSGTMLCACGKKSNTIGGEFAFTDALGRRVALAAQPQRVAALLGSFADVWLLAGGSLCAAAADAWEDFNLPLDSAVSVGGAHSPGLEQLLSANPDFVIASASTAKHLELQSTLEAMGVAVAYFDVDNFEDYLQMLDICTDITGRKDLFSKNGTLLQTQIDAVKAQYAADTLPAAQKKVLLLRASSGFVKAKGSRGTILGEMLADMGCINIADTHTSLLENLSVEAVIKEQPQHIFVVTMGSDTQKAMRSLEQLINENPAWSMLDAVLQNRMHVMDKSLFNLKPNARWAQAYEVLYEKLIQK